MSFSSPIKPLSAADCVAGTLCLRSDCVGQQASDFNGHRSRPNRRRGFVGLLRVLALVLVITLSIGAKSVLARPQATLAVDVASERVLVSREPDLRLRPASLAKLMTLHLALMAVDAKRIQLTDIVTVSAHAEKQSPVRAGLRTGQRLDYETLILATLVRSANDAAVALAEALGGSESAFVQLMNARATTLGLANTRFANASGLPSSLAFTTARDVAQLSLEILRTQRHWVHLFKRRQVRVAAKVLRGHNRWLSDFAGASGLKTGFTCRAGYHLAALSARNGRETLVIVLGARSKSERFVTARDITAEALRQPLSGQLKLALGVTRDVRPVPTVLRADACVVPRFAEGATRGPSGWSVVLEVFRGAPEAAARARRFRARYARDSRLYLVPRVAAKVAYQAGLTSLSKRRATAACLQARKDGDFCIVQQPATASVLWRQAQQSVRAARRSAAK